MALEQIHALIEGFSETLLFCAQGFNHMIAPFTESRIGITHFIGQHINQLMEEMVCDIQHISMTQCSADDPTKNIGAIFVAWCYTIGDKKRTGTNMICNHP